MRTRAIRLIEMLVRVRNFGVARSDHFPAPSRGGRLFAIISDAVSTLLSHAAAEVTGDRNAHEGTSVKSAARDALRNALDAVGRTARAVVADRPGAAATFRVPSRMTDQRLVAAAKAILAAATPLHDEFVVHNLPATFLDDLAAAIAAFEQAIGSRFTAVEARTSARANIDATLTAAVKTVRLLDPVVENTLKGDAGLLAEWRSARHVSRLTIPFPKEEHPTPAAPPAPTATVPTT